MGAAFRGIIVPAIKIVAKFASPCTYKKCTAVSCHVSKCGYAQFLPPNAAFFADFLIDLLLSVSSDILAHMRTALVIICWYATCAGICLLKQILHFTSAFKNDLVFVWA
ncbi:BA75_02965T0 [Komagataella pastoris]|uniref:BA75_02965T0 n=1 Tax=Komagataella pastoris TaxID=4922 RepID=A0A1B2JE71_PICPA|nr:BA75_02965T0 [Komagataella pastoris]